MQNQGSPIRCYHDELPFDEPPLNDHSHVVLNQDTLSLGEISLLWILRNGDEFVSQSRGNGSIESLTLYSCTFNEAFHEEFNFLRDERVWETLGVAIGNLQALKTIFICDVEDEDDAAGIPAWTRLGSILSHVRQSVKIKIDAPYQWETEEMLPFVQAIHGHPTITGFEVGYGRFPYESMSMLYSTLATLPALESVELGALEPDEGSTLANPETLTELLRVPTLLSVKFYCFYFTRALCQATANALAEGTEITDLEFEDCRFSDEECAVMMANCLSKNTSVTSIRVDESPFDEALKCASAAALVSNSTLRLLSFEASHTDMSPIFLALGKNSGLDQLIIKGCESMDESLCTAMECGLKMNETLRGLELHRIRLRDDNFALWCRALSFLRTKALRVLRLFMEEGVTESCASAFRMHIAAMLKENAFLEIMYIVTPGGIKVEEYVVLLTALQNKTTLKALRFHGDCLSLRLTDNEDKQLASLLRKNYGLEVLLDIHRSGDVGAILRLNAAGRRYLIQDGSSIPKGVEVLGRVNDDINCVFLHLLENPRLCDRSAVEMVNATDDNNRSTSPTASGDGRKRERTNAQYKGKESRRRLA
jgi:hypothetical protein